MACLNSKRKLVSYEESHTAQDLSSDHHEEHNDAVCGRNPTRSTEGFPMLVLGQCQGCI